MRSDAQITADLKAAYEAMEAEAKRLREDPRVQYPCTACRYCKQDGLLVDCRLDWECSNPLVKAFGKPKDIGTSWRVCIGVDDFKDKQGRQWRFPHPCGPEKALWQPKLTLLEKLIQFFSPDKEDA